MTTATQAGPTLVLAGNHRQHLEYVRSTGKPRNGFRYVGRPESLHGYRSPRVVCVGTWADRKDLGEIYDVLRSAGATFSHEGL